jgi:hypothetical protein
MVWNNKPLSDCAVDMYAEVPVVKQPLSKVVTGTATAMHSCASCAVFVAAISCSIGERDVIEPYIFSIP